MKLYDHIKDDGNHIVCLGQDQTKTFILLSSIRSRAHQLHPSFGPFTTVIIEPDRDHAKERQRILTDHTELRVVNLFDGPIKGESLDGYIVISSMRDIIDLGLSSERVNLLIFDYAHLLLLQGTALVKDVVNVFDGVKILAFMCSLIHNNHEFKPSNTINLVRQLETIFNAKCETSCDLRSLSRQSPVTNLDVHQYHPHELVTCDWFLLADSLLKQFCDFLVDTRLDEDEEPMLANSMPDLTDIGRGPILSVKKQLVLVRSCLSDVLYAMHCLGLWCTKKTIQLYLTEYSRLIHEAGPSVGDLIPAALTILSSTYSRFEDYVAHLNKEDKDDLIFRWSTQQLLTLLRSIKESHGLASSPWPLCIIHVRRRVIAKVIALWLDKISHNYADYDFIKANYIVGSARKHRNRMAVDNFDLHHEAAVRDFRFGINNVLVTSAVSERCTDLPRCNLVVSFDLPARFSDFIQAKGLCRNDASKYLVMLNKHLENCARERLLSYINMEHLLNNVNKRASLESEEVSLMETLESVHEPYPKSNSKNPATIWRSISIINKYCMKLPSDSFTKLSPEWTTKTIAIEGQVMYQCELRLPINSPVRCKIIGPKASTRNIAMRLAAFTACKVLHHSGELDDNMMPITKESLKLIFPLAPRRQTARPRTKGASKGSVGSTKHRQYYRKRIAKVFSGPQVTEGVICHLYKFNMVLTCPIPDEQNRRGRRIIDPSETNRNYAIVTTSRLPKICSFPVFTRSGEVMISVVLVDQEFSLLSSQIKDLRTFHEYTFSKVLRLEKYPTVYEPNNSPFTVLLAPVIEGQGLSKIDWKFVDKIVKSNDGYSHVPTLAERKAFKFNHEDYVDAVVIPWYRLTDCQQFAYYVAEICTDLNPMSPFPDENSGFKTFLEYYKSKYDLEIFNKEQPVLDVDHTSARLNLLTPRYVNRKGRTLPSSTAKTRRESRESLVQKQLLIPELCSIHPFPASFWRKAVCLPCIFYRLNSLFLAEELRRKVAQETRVGFVELPYGFEWPPLDFGWSLKDVINAQAGEEEIPPKVEEIPKKPPKISKRSENKVKSKPKIPEVKPSTSPQDDSTQCDFVIDHFDPSKLDIPDIALDAPPTDWMNIKLISSGTTSGDQGGSGWDQPLMQQDIFIEDTNEASWSDCEMDFDGEITQQVGRMRCGSPSAFELTDPKDSQTFSGSSMLDNTPSGLYSQDLKPNSKSVKFGGQLKAPKPKGESDELISSSDSSWSLSSDDQAELSNSDEEAKIYGEWKDSKSKNRPLLREIFLPSYRTSIDLTDDEIESLYLLMKDQVSATDASALNLAPIKPLKVVEEEDCKQRLVALINEIFEEKLNICDEVAEATLKNWYDTLKSLVVRVDKALCDHPDLFKDNGIELIAVDDSFSHHQLEMQPTFGELLPNRDVDSTFINEGWKSIKFDPSRSEIKSNGPGPSIILQALTMSNASDGINLERLETVGDSFLKYSITAYLYCMYPSMHEGKLSYLRSTEISNANLYQLGCSKNLGEIMSATKFEPNDNWLAPGYSVAESAPSNEDDDNKRREIDKALAEVPYDLLLQHSIPDKSIADCVEALIGAYLTASGSRAALLFMQWLGLNVVPPSFDLSADLKREDGDDVMWRWLGTPPSPLICLPPSIDELVLEKDQKLPSDQELKQLALDELDQLYYANNLDKFEQDIQYTFNDKAYLVQAFTHNSFYENHVTDCHQRLEFLGDALLDYLITRYLFEDPRCHSPGTLTDLRSALVNNTFFASLAVKYKFHKYLKYISDELFHVIDGFVKKFRFDSKDTITKGYTLLISEGESEYAEDTEVPKALGDVFESVAGAIYLDSGLSLDQVWQVYFKMMKPEIEYFSSNVPKSPIRELLESMPQNVRFSPSELAPDKKHRVIAEVFGLGRFTGVGRNKHSAKSTAAKRALRMLALRRKEQELVDEGGSRDTQEDIFDEDK